MTIMNDIHQSKLNKL